jgi:hypothetical protein
MTHHAISRLQHAFNLATMRAHWQTLQALAEVTKGAALLLLVALVTFLYRESPSYMLAAA